MSKQMARYRFDGSLLGLADELVMERNDDGTVRKSVKIGEEVTLNIADAEALNVAGLRLTRLDGGSRETSKDDDTPPARGSGTAASSGDKQ